MALTICIPFMETPIGHPLQFRKKHTALSRLAGSRAARQRGDAENRGEHGEGRGLISTGHGLCCI